MSIHETRGAAGGSGAPGAPAAADARRALPSIAALLEMPGIRALVDESPRALVVDAARAAVRGARAEPASAPRSDEAWLAAVRAELDRADQPSLRHVINATGIVLHTNLGRAPLAAAAIDAIARVAAGFSNLEYDLGAGARGSRSVHCAALLTALTGAEDALVVNNCAAALVLALNTVAEGRDAVISRGELVEIGGSFRIPEIMGKSGARLREVGTTNRTRAGDYAAALRAAQAEGARAGAILKVHRSNFALSGYVEEADVPSLAALDPDVPVIHDLGSGLLLALDDCGLTGEPTARDAVAAGAAIVVMSGDKLLGGPQAGIALGTRALIGAMRSNPLARSYRVDKLTLAALEATLALYRDPARARREIPIQAMLTAPRDAVAARAAALADAVRARASDASVHVVSTDASVGGGAFPTAAIPSAAIALDGPAPLLERRLRGGPVAVIGRIADGRVLLDVRTVLPDDEQMLIDAIVAALGDGGGSANR